MVEKTELKNDELTKIVGGNDQNDCTEVIKNAIYHGIGGYVYVWEIYDNRIVSFYSASFSKDVYRYGGQLRKSSMRSFCSTYEVDKPITNVTVEKI